MSAHEHSLRFCGTLEGLEQAATALRDLLEARAVDRTVRYNVEVVFEEIATNIVRHGSPTCDIDLAITFDEGTIVLAFTDDGQPFDPCARPDPVEPSSIDQAPVGGLGLVLVKKIATGIHYERTSQHNHLTLRIRGRSGGHEIG